ncbi:GMC family oxidoreductase [Haliea sp. E1-2-M8]|uniref:GMC oxidoreductase n=1 Tax=Haliea sp. E1-2-M8 TaxID=3064706 RepID=UPI002724C83B|nr:GMC family oxidoreductase [Haliea sp. E1-2-M8]MDO8864173.1 GMC family oxidoreductase [Haliea sp. E1-2-M8]
MLKSLQRDCPSDPIHADVAVVGGGLAGLFLADRLAQSGLTVVVLESGSAKQELGTHPLNCVEVLGEIYGGAEHGRFRCLGGTSTRWGGALLPYLKTDLDPHPLSLNQGWGIRSCDLEAHLERIEKTFGVQQGTYEGGGDLEGLLPGFLPRLPKWPVFANRNTANLFRKRIKQSRTLSVWLNATVTEILVEDGETRGLVAANANGARIEVRAPEVVLAAGAIETTRILLLLNEAHDGRLLPKEMPLGQGFHDHISAPIADLEVEDRNEIIRLFSFRFVRGGMRNLRFELSPHMRGVDRLPAAFAHVAFYRDGESGFDGLRKIFQSIQRHRFPAIRDVLQVLRDAPWFFAAVHWRFIGKRVLPPTGSSFELHLVTEQASRTANRITLSSTKKDVFGQPLAAIQWRINQEDEDAFWRVAQQLATTWRAGEIVSCARLKMRDRSTVLDNLKDAGGIYHPAGTTRIGNSASDGVVDEQLRVHGVKGLRALATSVFPSVGGSSPSLALIEFALRMADDIVNPQRRQQEA